MLIVIDGPAGSGKSAVAKKIANILEISYLDTGAMYRAVTYYILKNNISFSDEEKIDNLLSNLNFSLSNNLLSVNGKVLNEEIRSIEVTSNVKYVANNITIRKFLVEQQRLIASESNIILDGRDLGSFVFPNCDNKFYLTASIIERTNRRVKQNLEMGIEETFDNILESIKQRDENDINREFGGLKQANDAILIDSDNLTINEVVNIILENIKR